MKIYAFQLLNDFSGSPKVLMQLTKGWVKHGINVHLTTSTGRVGFLSNMEGVTYHTYWYRWASNPTIRLFNLSLSQLFLFLKMMLIIKKKDIIYVNTVLPFGAAILGKIIGCRVVYHIHETTMKPPMLKKLLFGIASWTANDVVYVSKFLSKKEKFKNTRTHILYNAIEDSFLQKAINNRSQNSHPKNTLMVCSLKSYKGIAEFVSLAQSNSQYNFRLVLNASRQEIDAYYNEVKLPSNLEMFETQTNLHPHYRWADVILNLSRPDGWVETFGLTIIEGMAYGLPAIVPPVGGITELVQENYNGYLVDCRVGELLNEKLKVIFGNEDKYNEMVQNSTRKINDFSEQAFIKRSIEILNK